MKNHQSLGVWPVMIGGTFHGALIVGADYEHKTVKLDWRQSNKINLVDICDGCPVPQEAGEWQARAQRAEAEVGKLTMDMQELLAENNDQKAMLADAGVRNAVLEKRLKELLDMSLMGGWGVDCPSYERKKACRRRGVEKATADVCEKCWRNYAFEKLEAVQL